MKSFVVYESMYGNTHQVAEAIGRGLAHLGEVTVAPVSDVAKEDIRKIDLLVVGGPTHVHGMSRPATRRAAVDEANNDDMIDLDPDAPGAGLREWLAALGDTNEVSCAAFDTRIDKPVILVGSAAKGISKRLKRHGHLEIIDPESFFVDDSAGPLRDGEVERAQRWGSRVANELTRIHRQRISRSR